MALSHVPDPKGLEGRKEGQTEAPQSRDFFWDSITLYVVAVILSLAAIDAVTEFVRPSEVQCYYPNGSDSSIFASVQDYVNQFCTGRVPPLYYLPALIAVHAIAILAPHYAWLNAYGADLDFFFTHVAKLKRTREVSTGDYHEINYIISEQLENAFSKSPGSNGMYLSYIVKLLSQITLCIGGIILVPLVLFKRDLQHITFECPDNKSGTDDDAWPLPPYETVQCVFSHINMLQKIWVVYLFLLALATLFFLCNLLLLVKWHTKELGFEKYARFSFITGIPYCYYLPDPGIILGTTLYDLLPGPLRKAFKIVIERLICAYRPYTSYHIHSDYDFLVVKLFRTDAGLGYILKDLHVRRCLKMENNSELERLNLYKTPSNDDFGKCLCDKIGWKLPDVGNLGCFTPVLTKKVITLPQTFLGVVLGCAMRCRGSYFTSHNIVNSAARCIRVAEDQQTLAEQQLPPSEIPNVDNMHQQNLLQCATKNKEAALKLKAGADTIVEKETLFSEAKAELVSLQKELTCYEYKLELALQRMKQVQELEAAAEIAKNKAVEQATDIDSVAIHTFRDEVEETSKLLIEQRLSLFSAVKCAAKLQVQVELKRKEVESKVDEVNQHEGSFDLRDGRSDLQTELYRLEHDQQELAFMQQDHARWIHSDEQLLRALELCGPDLVHALVIGFDMDSHAQGVACALARIFSRVGFINFSSHYTNYQDPYKVISNTPYIFSGITPIDVLTRDDDLVIQLSLDLKDEMRYTLRKQMSLEALDDMKEVWRMGYRQAKRKDEIYKLKVKLGIDTDDSSGDEVKKLDVDYSNFIVIGPVATPLQIATVNRILSKHKSFISQNALILTITPISVAGKEMDCKEYEPLPPYEPECLNVTLTEGESDVLVWPPTGYVGSVADTDFRLRAEDTTVNVRYKLYRRKQH